MTRAIWFIVLVAAACLPRGSGAQNESANLMTAKTTDVAPEHAKINTPDASPVDPWHIEIELAYAFERACHMWDNAGREHGRASESDNALALSVGVGLLQGVDFHCGWSYLWLRDLENDFNDDGTGPHSGQFFGDLDFSLRGRFLNDTERHLEMAYIVGVTAPTGSRSCEREIGTSQEYWSVNQTLVATKDWGRWTANTAVGYSLPFGNRREDARGVLSADAALGYQLLPWLQPEVELNYAHEFIANDAGTDVIAGTIGLVMPINERWRVNIGVQQGLWGRNTEKATTCVIALKWAF